MTMSNEAVTTPLPAPGVRFAQTMRSPASTPPAEMLPGFTVRFVCAGKMSVSVICSVPAKFAKASSIRTGKEPSSPETLPGMIFVTDAVGSSTTVAVVNPSGPKNGLPQASS